MIHLWARVGHSPGKTTLAPNRLGPRISGEGREAPQSYRAAAFLGGGDVGGRWVESTGGGRSPEQRLAILSLDWPGPLLCQELGRWLDRGTESQ